MNKHIRKNYEILGVEDFYKKIGGEYKNPHFSDIEKSLKRCVNKDFINFDNMLDLASGTGEATTIFKNLGYNNIIGCDPYLYREYTHNTGKKCLQYSFQDIHDGKLNNFNFETIICSYALHLADDSILPYLYWNLSLISDIFIIISPNNKPFKNELNWELKSSFKEGKARCRVYKSKNIL